MLQELATRTGAQIWVIASMLFFVAAYAVVAVRAWRTEPEVLNACAHLPLAGDGEAGHAEPNPSRADRPNPA